MNANRFDRTVRLVMWLDAALSVSFVAACTFGAPLIAVVGVPHWLWVAVIVTAGVSAVLLGIFGPIYAVLLMMRMHRGEYLLPPDLRLPLPTGMRPAMDASGSR